MINVVSAMFERRDQATGAIHDLKARNFASDELRIIAAADAADRAAHEEKVARRDVRAGGWAGALIGAVVGGLVGLISIVLNPVLPLLVIGGGIVGWVVGNWGGHGIAQEDERKAERTLDEGGALVVVREPDDARAKEALELLEKAGAHSAAIAKQDYEVPTP
jgi:uncharacterized membrane protein